MEDTDLIRQLVILVVLLLLSAFFSGSETAFFSLNSLEKDLLRRKTAGGRGRFVQLLFSRPDEVLVTILTGNMFVNIFATSISEALGDHFFKQSAEVVSIVAMTIILLLVGEMTPKNLAIRHSLGFSRLSVSVMRYLHTLAWPIVVPLGKLRKLIISFYPASRLGNSESRSSAVLSAIRMGYQNKTIERSELVLLERFFRFRDRTAADVMVPRVDSSPVDIATTIPELLEQIARPEFDNTLSLIPLVRDDVDHIVGYIRRSDLIPFRFGGAEETRLASLSRPDPCGPCIKTTPGAHGRNE